MIGQDFGFWAWICSLFRSVLGILKRKFDGPTFLETSLPIFGDAKAGIVVVNLAFEDKLWLNGLDLDFIMKIMFELIGRTFFELGFFSRFSISGVWFYGNGCGL